MTLNIEIEITAAAVSVVTHHGNHTHLHNADLQPGDSALAVQAELLQALAKVVRERSFVRAIEATLGGAA
jgi:hypothetical protein